MTSKTFVPPLGPLNAPIILVGEQPGSREVRHRKPFIGPAGEELNNCLHAAGISRQECYLTNVIKDLDQPIANYINLKGAPLVSKFGREYLEMLEDELSNHPANVIVAIGNIALYALAGRKGITKWRGSIIESTMLPGRKVIPIIHPATIIPPKNIYLNKYLIVNDLVRVREESTFPDFRVIPRHCRIQPSFTECMEFLDECIKVGYGGGVIDLDIEVVGEELSCISFAYKEDEAISIPFYDGQEYFPLPQEEMIMRKIADIIQSPSIALGGQNIIFDLDYLLSKYKMVPAGPLHCSMIGQKILMPDFNVGLDFITSVHTDIPYYKEDGKQWMKVGGAYKTFWQYNALDSIATAASREPMLTALYRQGNSDTYSRKCKSIYPYMDMMQRGILVNMESFMKEREETAEKIKEVEDRLYSVAGYKFNYRSPKQVMHHLHEVRGLQPYRKRKGDGWTPSSDEDAMKRHSRNGVEEAKIILELRRLSKRLSNYLDPSIIREDGRITTQYKPHGTVTGRPSSGSPIIGVGTNLQNWPHSLLSHLIPDPGYWFLSFDLSQIENRIVAYVGRIHAMIAAFESGIDVHRLTAGLVFGISANEVSDESGSCDLGDGTHSQRDYGKKANHSLNYDYGYKNFALKYEIPERQAKWLVERYHHVYPEVRENYHDMVVNMLQESRTLENLYGRKRKFLNRWGNQLFKDAYAHIPQSTTADKMDEEGLNFIYYNQSIFSPIELLNIIHDSIGFQIPLSTPWKRQAEMLMLIKANLETPLRWRGREFVIPADLTIGFTLNKDDGVELKHKNFPATADQLAVKLKEIYDDLTNQRR